MKKVLKVISIFVFIIGAFILSNESIKAEAAEISGDWKIYDDMDENIEYSSRVVPVRGDYANYLGTFHGFPKGVMGETCKFNFTGNKLALRGEKCYQYTNIVLIQIDGVNYYFSVRTDDTHDNYVIFTKEGLGEGEHSAVIKNIQGSPNPYCFDFRIDAVEVALNGDLIPFHKTQDNSLLKIKNEVTTTTLNDILQVNLSLNKLESVKGEEAVIEYDPSKLQLISLEKVKGINYRRCKKSSGRIEVILLDDGEGQSSDYDKILLNMKFKSLQRGNTFITVSKEGVQYMSSKKQVSTDTIGGQAVVIIK